MNRIAQHLNDAFTQLQLASRRADVHALRPQLPYALLLDDGWVLPLNRGYSPVGSAERGFIDYSTSNLWFPDVWLDYQPEDLQGDHIFLGPAGMFGRLHERRTRIIYLAHCRRVLWPLLEIRERMVA